MLTENTLTDLQKTIPGTVPLGQKSPYPKCYDKGLLQPVKRSNQRHAMRLPEEISFKGFDVWNAYELFWLNLFGKPMRACATFAVPANSPNICESKSVKLYLHSLNHERFSTMDEVAFVIKKDLSEICDTEIGVTLTKANLASYEPEPLASYLCLDELEVNITKYERAPELLAIFDEQVASEKLVTHLFKSHCLCTGQPDMGSIFIEYIGKKIDHRSLLLYLVSYRDHVGFSENCIEQIFVDIFQKLRPQMLTVFGRFTRRGGIDINPYRSTHDMPLKNSRLIFQ